MRQLSFGAELELANVDCFRDIPKDIGAWECGDKRAANGAYLGKETCIMNSDGTPVDPDKIRCTKGGELHVVPAWNVDDLMNRIQKLFELFPEADMFLPGKMHIHVGIPNWTFEDIKNIYAYTEVNEEDFMDAICGEKFCDKLLNDLKIDQSLKDHYMSSRRTIHNKKTFSKVKDFDTLKEMMYWWGDRGMFYFPKPIIKYKNIEKASEQSIRVQSLHIQHLLKHNTCEFRNFASTTDLDQLKACVLVAERYIQDALAYGADAPRLKDWIGEYNIPEWDYDSEVIQKWWDFQKTQPAHTAGGSGKTFHTFEVK